MLILHHSNHRPRYVRRGSRGSRLTPKLLREVLGWVTVRDESDGVSLCARDTRRTGPESTTALPSLGLYLNFSDGFPFARVRLGSGTKFDVIPAYVTPEKDHYALTVGDKWVMFNVANQEVVLTEWLKDSCLFQKRDVKVKKKAMRIVLEAGGKFFQLRVQGTQIKDWDDDDETSEVSMVEYPLDDDKDELVSFLSSF